MENLEQLRSTTATSTTTTLPITTITTQRTVSEDQPLYRLNSSNGRACILLQVDSVVDITFRTKLGEEEVNIKIILIH